MTRFKAAPIVEAAQAGFADLDTVPAMLSTAAPARLLAWFWPALLGGDLVITLVLADRRDTLLLVACLTVVGQVVMVLAPPVRDASAVTQALLLACKAVTAGIAGKDRLRWSQPPPPLLSAKAIRTRRHRAHGPCPRPDSACPCLVPTSSPGAAAR